jgi:hypothetical protein
VVVPPPGEAVEVDAVDEFGQEVFNVETMEDGTVILSLVGSETDPTSASGTTGILRPRPLIAACSDNTNNVQSYKESDLHEWRIKTSSIPTDLNQANAITRIRNSISNITQAFNDCGLPDNVSATSNYLGSTTFSATFDGDNCLTNGGPNIVDFGPINNGRAAVACTYAVSGEVVGADVRMNSGKSWTVAPGTNCSGKFDIESVMTHERGHTFGIGHVTGSTHTELTMYESVPLCDTSKRTLGKGDVVGLEVLY